MQLQIRTDMAYITEDNTVSCGIAASISQTRAHVFNRLAEYIREFGQPT
jgi:hypothetical protein